MADYKEIFGQKIQSLATDPAVDIPGQIWYNSASADIKANIFYNGVWVTGSAVLNQGRKTMGGAGSGNTDGVIGGGIQFNPPGTQTNTGVGETYDGSTWTTSPSINTVRRSLTSSGLSGTSALIYGGYLNPYTGATEEWNGSSWSSKPSLSNARDTMGGAGSVTSALAIGGGQGISVTSSVESFDGSAWTASPTLPTMRIRMNGFGPSNTDALAWGGLTYAAPTGYTSYDDCNIWNGTTWAAVNPTVNAGQGFAGHAGNSTSSALSFGGSPDTQTESWDGTCWTSGSAMPIGQSQGGANNNGPSSTSAFFAGGSFPGASPGDQGYTGTQEYQYGASKVTLTTS
jgi:hypothetical protein